MFWFFLTCATNVYVASMKFHNTVEPHVLFLVAKKLYALSLLAFFSSSRPLLLHSLGVLIMMFDIDGGF